MTRRQFASFSLSWVTGFLFGLSACGKMEPSLSGQKVITDVVAEAPKNPYDTHTVTIHANVLSSPPSGGITVATVPQGHTVTLSEAQLRTIANGSAVTKQTDPDQTGHHHDFTFQLT